MIKKAFFLKGFATAGLTLILAGCNAQENKEEQINNVLNRLGAAG